MKFKSFTEKKRSDKAILINAFVEETGKEESFWLPLAKIEIQDNSISIEDKFWAEKLDELRNPTEELITIESNEYEKGEKATKLVVNAKLKELPINVFIWIPNSKVVNMELFDKEDKRLYKVTFAKWLWKNSYKNAITNQLEFYNKDKEENEKFSEKDFTLLSNVD